MKVTEADLRDDTEQKGLALMFTPFPDLHLDHTAAAAGGI